MPPSDSAERRHTAAIEAGEAGYLDPDSGLFVLTGAYLAARGECCGNACRHCPFGHVNVVSEDHG